MNRPTIRLTVCGAARTVTGSKYLLEVDDKKILFDCGLFQGQKELRLRNWNAPPFDPAQIDAVVLTHAHVDHTGYLPKLVQLGFRGPIYCTAATSGFLALLLPDSAHLQEEEARFANKHETSKHKPAKPLYNLEDARAALELVQTIPRGESTELFPGIRVTPLCAGHILGSTSLSIDCYGKRITISGDIGRYDSPILPDPTPVDIGDLILCESTYGDREHKLVDTKAELTAVVKRAYEKKGPLIIPAFAIGRTQTLLYHLAELEREGEIPELPVYIDSPMAVDATRIYRAFKHDFDEDSTKIIAEGGRPLQTARTTLCKESRESKKLNKLYGPRIIISASGMVTGGRILHHMTHWLPKEDTTVLFVGYQAEGTRGRTIQSGAEKVKIFGKHIPIRADVHTISGLSAHGDYTELLRWLSESSGSPSHAKIVHGESESAMAFAERVRTRLSWTVSVAEHLEVLEI